MSEDDEVVWQDVLDAVVSGKMSNLDCPFCKKAKIEVTKKERVTRLLCPGCRKYIEVGLGDEW